jgi:hypothetical protein
MKNSSDTIGNGTRHLPACSIVPQPRARLTSCKLANNSIYNSMCLKVFKVIHILAQNVFVPTDASRM